MIADCEDLRESEASNIYVKRFKNQELFVKGEYEFPCATRTLRLPDRPRPSLIAEGNLEPEDDVEIEDRDEKKKEKQKVRGP